MSKIFNSEFEISLRIICVLKTSPEPLSVEKIQIIDFIATYGKDFGLAKLNLHGDNAFKKGEIYARKALINSSIKKMVLEGLVEFTATKEGFHYCLSKNGRALFDMLNDEYAYEYSKIARELVKKSEDELNRIIQQ